MADHGDLGGGAVFHHVQQGHNGSGGEVHILQLAAEFEQFLTEWQGHQFQVFKQGFQDFTRQGGQQFVLLCTAIADNRPGRNFEFPRAYGIVWESDCFAVSLLS